MKKRQIPRMQEAVGITAAGRVETPGEVVLFMARQWATAMKIYLVPEDGSPPHELVKDITLIGRSRICDIQLLDKAVSKLHCVLVKTDSLVLVRDLGSTNGTRVKDLAVKRGFLLPGDVLEIGRLRFRVQFLADDAPPPQPSDSWVQTQQMAPEEVEQILQESDKDDSPIEEGPPSSPLPPQLEVVQFSQNSDPAHVPPIPPVVEVEPDDLNSKPLNRPTQ